ncbi:ATP-grasp domain-containing protein [Streptomyces sp. NPDC057287]|uniref:ATP-grasp domain-containing protein n=1 Tax=Streptomyces sp. NPDC057287 TaxID=3346086 RepID=UPI0036270074
MARAVLLLGAESETAEHLVLAAEALDVGVHVAVHRGLYRTYAGALRRRLADVVFSDFRTPMDALDQLSEHCAREGIGGVAAGGVFLSPLAASLADRLGLPGNTPGPAPAGRDKWLMAQAFRERGVPHPRTLAITAFDDAVPSVGAAGLDYPVIVKPAESSASVGVSLVDSPDHLAGAIRVAQRRRELRYGAPLDGTVLVQQYLRGIACSVVTVAHRGTYEHLAILRKYTAGGRGREGTGHTVPADIDPRSEGPVLAAVERGLAALGLNDGVAQSDLVLTAAGPKLITVDVGPPDVPTMQVIEHASGVDVAAVYLQTVLGERPDTGPRRTGAAAIRFITTVRHGVFRGLDGLAGSPHVALVRSYVEPGELIGNAHAQFTRLGHVIVQAPSPAQADLRADEAIACISSRVEP